ncbi:hypothetical protein QFZ53_001702 [Microbacterium natoriense]|uniref:Uncharacterized protein n=1 Tax=Microbacterium natoriense TaxID=284570 RepID=A0AAW8EZ41_9MICO|nr:hypothetical protein [Microbacterium natoriense]MDQ0647506.1 hypothetical protein [Microbacterium natoriense]
METAATVFSVAVPGQTNKAQIENRLALIEKIEAPADLADDLDVWTGYLEAVAGTIDAEDPSEALAAYRDDLAVKPAGTALFDQYVDGRMKSELHAARSESNRDTCISKRAEDGVGCIFQASPDSHSRLAVRVELRSVRRVSVAHPAYRLDTPRGQVLPRALSTDPEIVRHHLGAAHLLEPTRQLVDLLFTQLPGTDRHRRADRLRPMRSLHVVDQNLWTSCSRRTSSTSSFGRRGH